jgi:uncharacterized protein YbdZ (MbtH family)
MTRNELKDLIWKIYRTVIKDEEKGYNLFEETHHEIPDEWYEVYSNELQRMCIMYLNLNDNDTTTTKTITFHQILIYLRNDCQQINPALKLEFRDNPKVNCNSFVKYFKLLKKEGIILNTNEDLSKILNFITKFGYGTIFSNVNDLAKTAKIDPLLPKGYVKEKVQKKIIPF